MSLRRPSILRVQSLAALATLLFVSVAVVVPAAAAPAPEQPAPVNTVRKALHLTPAVDGLPLTVHTGAAGADQIDAEASGSATPAGPDPVIQTAEGQVGGPVAVVAVTLPSGGPDAEIYVRQVTDGTPTGWTSVHLDPASEDGGSPVAGTDPIVVTDADSVQVAVVSSRAVDASLSVMTSPMASTDAVSSDFALSNPQIRSRRAWGANESLKRYPYSYGTVTGAMIHHTAGTNSYTADQVPAILRSIQAYHVNGRGWNDIGYNFLVDKFGRAWEGRGGGVLEPVQGGHAWGVTNARVTGVSMIGNFDSAAPSAAMLDTAERVIAWKFRQHGGVNPYGSTSGSGGQDGGSTFLNAISGHRDENSTACPGRYLYQRFGEIRSKVDAYMRTTYTAPVPYWVGGAIGALWRSVGGERGGLGRPQSGERCGRAQDGCYQNFERGSIWWRPGAPAFVVLGAVRERYRTAGAEGGLLGYPTMNEVCGLPGRGCYQHFQGGSIYWSPATDAQWVTGGIRELWASTRWERGWLGYPTMSEECGLPGGGCYQHFQGGSIYWSPATDARWVTGGIRDYWASAGWERGPLGYPTTNEIPNSGVRGGVYQDFQGGRVHWTPSRGVYR